MFSADPKTLQRIEAGVRRVMIVDPTPASAKLLADLMKGLGARDVLFEPEERRALDLARDFNPDVIFVERSGPKLDGESLTRRLRRSSFHCRKAPVIMVTAEATATTIKGARDSGVHEFLRKPFTAGELLKRVEAVAIKPRDWIEAVQYVGPDRRRFNSAEFSGEKKRQSDRPKSASEAQAQAMDQAVRILRAAVVHFEKDPTQAVRAIQQQATTLRALAMSQGNSSLAIAVAELERALAGGAASLHALLVPVKGVIDLFKPNAPPEAKVA